MRVPSLLALTAAGALLLPVAANAGNFPAGKEAAYMTQCTQVASGQGVDAATAKKHCDCGAQAIKKNFTDLIFGLIHLISILLHCKVVMNLCTCKSIS